jgi:peptide chain release factor 2
MADSGFWDNQEKAKAVMKERSDLEHSLKAYNRLKEKMDDAEVLLELAEEEDDQATLEEASSALDIIESGLSRMEAARLMSGPDDARSAILAINSGAGGTDAQDWAEMLLRLYTRFAERQGFEIRLLDLQEGEEAGIKSATLELNGHQAYGLCKGESGIHRLVRISPFDSNHRRHTAFASVFVSPQVDDDIEIEILDSDLRVDVYRASGAGGQHVNKTSSAVRLTHLPTGVVVQCQNEKSQHRNKDLALKVLKARLYEMEMAKREAEKKETHEGLQEIGWGSQIRSYVLAPYRMVKDHRTGQEMGNVDAVLDGDLDKFIEAFLHWRADRQGK